MSVYYGWAKYYVRKPENQEEEKLFNKIIDENVINRDRVTIQPSNEPDLIGVFFNGDSSEDEWIERTHIALHSVGF